MIRIHYRHLPMWSRFYLHSTGGFVHQRYHSTSELLRADAEGIKISTDRLVYAKPHDLNCALRGREPNAN